MSNATLTFFIFLATASGQRALPFALSRACASSTLFGTSVPNLCVFLITRHFTAETVWSLFLRAKSTHQAKAGLLSIQEATEHSATSIGLDSFLSTSLSQLVEPSFHWMQSCHPWVLFFLCFQPLTTTWPSAHSTACPSYSWPMLASNSWHWLPSMSH